MTSSASRVLTCCLYHYQEFYSNNDVWLTSGLETTALHTCVIVLLMDAAPDDVWSCTGCVIHLLTAAFTSVGMVAVKHSTCGACSSSSTSRHQPQQQHQQPSAIA